MNERIKELADQAELTIRTGRGNTYMSHPEFNKKFAELIIRACADVAKETRWAVPPSQEQIARGIQQHFGVEE